MHIDRREFVRIASLTGVGATLPTNRAFAAAERAPSSERSTALIGESAYRHWQNQCRFLLEPLSQLFRAGYASLDIRGPASANGAAADRLESFARPMLLAAHYLQSKPETGDEAASANALRETTTDYFRGGLLAGTDPKNSHYWGPDANYHQLHVEMGLVAITLQIAPEQLWNPFTNEEKDQVATWLATARHSGYVDNNHYFMGIHVLEFLRRYGYEQPSDLAIVDEYFFRLEAMHRGNGWFQDGINQAFDYYNAYAFNFYGLWWGRLHGSSNPERTRRWKGWARSFIRDYQHFFAASGEHPAFGRSITYRFNSIAPFGLAVLEDCTDLPLGRIRRISTRNLDFFLSKPVLQEQGCLSVGWLDEYPESAELYTCAGSPYWAAKGFSPLLIPPEHPFWSEPEDALPSEKGDHAYVIKPAGLTLRSVGGEVEILNSSSQVSHTNLRYGAWKWSKTAYRTGRSFNCAFPAQGNWSLDSALTARTESGKEFGRHSTVAVEMADTHTIYSWNLGYAWIGGDQPDQTNVGVRTGIWWNSGWLLQVHRYEAQQPVRFRLGSYSLPLADRRVDRQQNDFIASAWGRSNDGTLIQPLAGFSSLEWDQRLDGTSPRTHLAAPFHITPVAVSERLSGSGYLAALVWTGSDKEEAKPWQLVATGSGAWKLRHPKLGGWKIEHSFLPGLSSEPTL